MFQLRLLLLFSTLSSPYFLLSQTDNHFVEVIVEDSISLLPDEVIFSISIIPIYQHPPDDDEESFLKRHQSQYDSVARTLDELIKQQGVEKMPINSWTVNTSSRDVDGKLFAQLRFRSPEKLQQFISVAGKIKGVYGIISSTSSSKKDRYNGELYKRLMRKAKEEASLIAQHSNHKLGQVMQVKEQDIKDGGGWTAYPPLSAIGMEDIFARPFNITIYKKFAVKFAW